MNLLKITFTSLIVFTAFCLNTLASNPTLQEVEDTTNGWKKGGFISINFSQVKLDNWAAGGVSSVSLNSLLSCFLNYRRNDYVWSNNLDMAYGLLSQGGKTLKTDDRIDITSKLEKEAFKKWYYALLYNFKTQFAPGYKYPNDTVKISTLLAPAYTLLSLGLAYRKYENFTFFISPITARHIYVGNQDLANAGAFGVQSAIYDSTGKIIRKAKNVRFELGGFVKLTFKKDIMQNVSLQSKLELFSDYLNKPENVDVFFDLIVAMKINKYLSANIIVNLIYDDNTLIPTGRKINGLDEKIGPRLQLKEIFGLGLSYKF